MTPDIMYHILLALRTCQEKATKGEYYPHSADGAKEAVTRILAGNSINPKQGKELLLFADYCLADSLDVQDVQDYLRDIHHINETVTAKPKATWQNTPCDGCGGIHHPFDGCY